MVAARPHHSRAYAAGLLLTGAAVAAGTVTAGAAAGAPEWRVTSGDVRVHCPLTIGGSFEAKTSSLSGTLSVGSTQPVALTGSLSVDLRTLDTGIGLRNDHMRGRYLEVDKGEGFAKAVLSEIRLTEARDETFQGTTPFTGTLSLHGTSRPVAGRARVRRDGAATRVEASFPVRIPEYGIAKPRYLGVGVKDEVQVEVTLVAAPTPPAGGGR